MENNYNWTDNPTVAGVSVCDTDVLNDCLMHLKYNNNNSAGVPLLYIGQSFYVDESLGMDYYLNGQILTINQNIQDAVNKLKIIRNIRPSLFTTEANWQSEKNLSVYNQVGKFVINESAGTLRLPAIVNLQGLFDLTRVGTLVNAGLPNIKGTFQANYTDLTATTSVSPNAFYSSTPSGNRENATVGAAANIGVSMDASRYNSIYGNSSTVQVEAIQYPFFIRLATKQETTVKITNEIELNNPYSMFDIKYAEKPLYNSSWLQSNGQYNSRTAYVTAFEGLMVERNGSIAAGANVTLPSGTNYSKRGLTVKLKTESFTDYDWVVDTSNSTFRLPLKTRLTTQTGLLLYFYVGDTVQNANIINAGRIGEQVLSKLDRIGNETVVQTYKNGDSWYRLWSDNWLEQGGYISNQNTVNLLKNYADSKYCITTCKTGMAATDQSVINITAQAVNSFSIARGYTSGSASGTFYWYACGF